VILQAAADGDTIADAVRLVGSAPAPANVAYIHSDHLGTPQKMTDASKVVTWDRVQDPFGNTHSLAGAPQNPLRFPGQYADEESALSYNYFRDYDPTLGRYVQSDPIGLRGGYNTYVYVADNPTNNVDSLGLDTIYTGAQIKVPEIPWITEGGGSSFGFALSFPGITGGELDFGLYCEIAKNVDGSASIGGTGRIGAELGVNAGSVRDMSGMGAEIQADIPVTPIPGTPIPNPIGPSVGGAVHFDKECSCLTGGAINVGIGSSLVGQGTKTFTFTYRDVFDWLSNILSD
jgi:RHS repeat-associated protein